ncbi:hypothetical protein ABZP36_005500 [Zizania latifolia]
MFVDWEVAPPRCEAALAKWLFCFGASEIYHHSFSIYLTLVQAWVVPRRSRLEWGLPEAQLAAMPTSCRAALHWLSSMARSHGNVGYELPLVFPGLIKSGSGRCSCAAGMVGNTGDQVGDNSDDGVNVTNEKLRAVICKSKEVLAIHRNLLEKMFDMIEVPWQKSIKFHDLLDLLV